MGVFRINKNKNYTVMSNVHLRDKALPLKAKGLLSLMLSLPEDWDYSMRGLAKLSADGLDSTRAAVKALERSGYLEMHRPILFNELVLSDKLFEHCAEIDEAARNRMELIVPELAKRNGVTEQLKADNQMEWVRQMNACKAQAEAIVKFELIYD